MIPAGANRGAVTLAWAAAAGFLLLTVLVAAGASVTVDSAAREAFRPHDAWGAAQVVTRPVIDGLEPRRAFALLVLVAFAMALARRSWRPLATAALAIGTASAATLLTKYAVGRTDPHLDIYGGGSYPSGHMVADIVTAGCILLLLVSRARWWMWLSVVAPVGLAMALAMLFTAAHWLTDLVGGALLSVVVLAVLSASPASPAPDGRTRARPADG